MVSWKGFKNLLRWAALGSQDTFGYDYRGWRDILNHKYHLFIEPFNTSYTSYFTKMVEFLHSVCDAFYQTKMHNFFYLWKLNEKKGLPTTCQTHSTNSYNFWKCMVTVKCGWKGFCTITTRFPFLFKSLRSCEKVTNMTCWYLLSPFSLLLITNKRHLSWARFCLFLGNKNYVFFGILRHMKTLCIFRCCRSYMGRVGLSKEHIFSHWTFIGQNYNAFLCLYMIIGQVE